LAYIITIWEIILFQKKMKEEEQVLWQEKHNWKSYSVQ
jgi:hypothetical protein